jgi:site-specific recombinase XerD
MPKHRTSTPSSSKERTGIDRLYKRVGKRKISWYYQHPDNTSETLATATPGDRKAIADAERIAKRKALDIQQGVVVAGSVAEMIERFRDEIAPTHYRDQSKEGMAVRAGTYANLIKFFGAMQPLSLKTLHGYQYLEARAKAGAPAKANKELSLMSTICHYAVRWGLIEANPFTDMMQNRTEKDVRTIYRHQVMQFYRWTRHQRPAYQALGCAALFAYLTGFRAAEVRPFHVTGLTTDGVRVINAKRKKGQEEVVKLRDWSPRLRTVVARAKATHTSSRMYLFANSKGRPYSKSGWGSVWTDVMFDWIASFDKDIAAELAKKREWEAQYRAARKTKEAIAEYGGNSLIQHPMYFALSDTRPAAITQKLNDRANDAYDFAAHANPATTHRHYDRRIERRAKATE